MGKRDPDEILEICGDMLDAGVRPLVKAGRLKGKVVVAADEHTIPRCDRGGGRTATSRAARGRAEPTSSSAT